MQSFSQHFIEKGHVEGRVEGRAEGFREASYTIARNMLLKQIAIDIIADTTGLSCDEIEELQPKLAQ